MKRQETPQGPYKRMSDRSTRAPAAATKTGKPPAPPSPKRRTSPSQLLIILLLSAILLILSALVYLFFQPERVQLWQESFHSAELGSSAEGPLVKRLTPAGEEPPAITDLPVPPEEPPAPPEPKESPAPEKRTREARLFYVKVNTEGQISLKSQTRPVEYGSSPLTRTVNTLLEGPSSDEINKGSLTLIPEGTRLLSARVEGSTAYLNFNEAFRFNSLGREGYTAQLKQIVYTATEFPTVDAVQILIEGSRKEYLGGEGIYVGEPLSRETFRIVP